MLKRKRNLCCPKMPAKSRMRRKNAKENLAALAKAISHPVRIRIIEILKSHKNCICGEIVDALPIAQATVSQHLKVLKDAGWIRGTIAGPATCYCLNPDRIRQFKRLIKNL